ncbi:MAG: NRDE family protein [Sphingobacteriales bacterium]|nr:MAG: NRDE family protein [Sphingobacteriales bacterium]
MCTFTFLPLGNYEFIATSNRDEQPDRAAYNFSDLQNGNGVHLLFPKEPKAGGTWLATSNDNRLVTVLNGAFERHERKSYYKRSRGLMALDFFDYPGAQQFFQGYDFDGIEPFTMIIFDKGNLLEYRWDGETQYIKPLKTDLPYIWSSAALYTTEARIHRQQWFDEWLHTQQTFSRESIFQFHSNAGSNDPHNGLVMNRFNMVKTVSIASIQKTLTAFDWYFQNLVTPQTIVKTLVLS